MGGGGSLNLPFSQGVGQKHLGWERVKTGSGPSVNIALYQGHCFYIKDLDLLNNHWECPGCQQRFSFQTITTDTYQKPIFKWPTNSYML